MNTTKTIAICAVIIVALVVGVWALKAGIITANSNSDVAAAVGEAS